MNITKLCCLGSLLTICSTNYTMNHEDRYIELRIRERKNKLVMLKQLERMNEKKHFDEISLWLDQIQKKHIVSTNGTFLWIVNPNFTDTLVVLHDQSCLYSHASEIFSIDAELKDMTTHPDFKAILQKLPFSIFPLGLDNK